MADDSVDAVVIDPPAGISFMGAAWDGDKGGRRQWVAWLQSVMVELLRVTKPGGHALVWALPRTSHWTGWACEEAGWEVRDKEVHLFFTGFPKSLDISRSLDDMAGAEREVVGSKLGLPGYADTANTGRMLPDSEGAAAGYLDITAPATPEAKQWEGFGTGLKPAYEDWWLLRKPISESSIARNVLKWGTGALNIDGCRYAYGDTAWPGPQEGPAMKWDTPRGGIWTTDDGAISDLNPNPLGRFPANVYACQKPSRAEKETGCEHLPAKTGAEAVSRAEGSKGLDSPRSGAGRTAETIKNIHSTVKPVALMRWLCRLVTPPGGLVLDCFMGSGTTGVAATLEGFDFEGVEMSGEFVNIARARIKHAAVGGSVEGDGADPEPLPFTQVGLFG